MLNHGRAPYAPFRLSITVGVGKISRPTYPNICPNYVFTSD